MRYVLVQIALALALIVGSSGAGYAQQVWKWVDKNGVTHYSDQPAPGAVRVDLHVQTYDSEAGAIPTTASAAKPKAPAPTYRSIRITQPANDDTVTGTNGVITVNVQVEPALQIGHGVLLTLDGQQVTEPGATTSFTLNDVSRGTHTLAVSVVDSNGESIISGNSVQFHMQQPVVRAPKPAPK